MARILLFLFASFFTGLGLVIGYWGFINDFRSDGPGGLIFWFGPIFSFFFAWMGWVILLKTLESKDTPDF